MRCEINNPDRYKNEFAFVLSPEVTLAPVDLSQQRIGRRLTEVSHSENRLVNDAASVQLGHIALEIYA